MPKKPASPHEVSLAVMRLRRAMHMTQAEFAREMHCAQSLVARHETTAVPGLRWMRRFLELAEKQKLPEIAEVFRRYIETDDREWKKRGHIARVASPQVNAEAQRLLTQLWHTTMFLAYVPPDNPLSRDCQIVGANLQYGLLELADLILDNKRDGMIYGAGRVEDLHPLRLPKRISVEPGGKK